MVECLLWEQDAAGSNPVASTSGELPQVFPHLTKYAGEDFLYCSILTVVYFKRGFFYIFPLLMLSSRLFLLFFFHSKVLLSYFNRRQLQSSLDFTMYAFFF